MKSCPKCNVSYQDIENYCIECGTRLVVKKPKERIKTVIKHVKPPKDIPILKRKIEKLEKVMAKPPKPEIPEELKSKINKLEKRISSIDIPVLESRINKLEGELKRIEKSAKRIEKIKFLPKEETISLLSKVNELEQKLVSVSEIVSRLEVTKPPRPGIPKVLKAKINKLEEKVSSIPTPVFEKRINKLEGELKRIEKSAKRIGKIKFLPEEEMISLLSKVNELDQRLGSVSETVSGLEITKPKPEISEELKAKINKLEKSITSIRALTLKDRIHKLENRVTSIHAPVLEEKINKLEKTVSSIPTPVFEKRINKLEGDLKSTLNEIKRVEKSAKRIGRIKFLPKEEAMSLVGEIGELERRVETISEKIAEIRTVPENIEEIAGYGKNMDMLKKNVQTINSKVKGLTGFIKDNEKTLDDIEKSLRDIIKKSDLKDFQGTVTGDMDSLKEDIRRKISSNSARVTRLSKRLAEQYKTLADFTKTKERLVLDQKKRLDRIDKIVNTTLETMENRVVKASKEHAEDVKTRIEGELETISDSLARREEFENTISQDIGNLKQDKEAIAELRKGIKEQKKSLGKFMNFKMGLTKDMEDFRDVLMADQEKGFKSLDRFKEKIMLIIGLALQQQARSKKMSNRLKDMIEKRIAEIREQNNLLIKKTEARVTSLETSAAVSSRDLRSRLDEELQSVNEALENMEKGISARLSSMSRKAVSKSELEDLRKKFDAEGTRIADIRDQLIEQGKVLEEIEGMKENLIAEQKQKTDKIETELRQGLDKLRTEGKKILVDAEDEIRSDFEMKLQNIDKMEKRMEEELDALNKNLAKRKEFESYMNEDIEALKAEIGTLDAKVKEKITDEKKAIEKEIEEEVRDLGRAKKEFYERLSLLKKDLNKSIKTAVKKEMVDFEELKVEHDNMIKMMISMKQSKADMDMSIEKLKKDTISEKSRNKKLREKARMELDRVRVIGSDSQEKLGMVKDFIDNIEKRFRIEIESLEERLEKIIKIQEKQELERISPLKLKKRAAKKPGK
jgi:chromosome segregation ATPase